MKWASGEGRKDNHTHQVQRTTPLEAGRPLPPFFPVPHPSTSVMSDPKGAEAWDGRFGTDETAEEDDSGVCSPPMWRSSSPQTLSDGGRRHYRRARRHLSPASRIQAIERGRMELMEMVRNMPESSYELSLKDLVEHQPPSTAAAEEEEEEEVEDQRGSHSSAEGIARQRSEKKAAARLKRSGSADKGGFLLKLVFPIRFGSNRTRKSRIKKNNSVGSNGSWSKVSPKPAAAAAAAPDKEWWKKRSKDAGGSEGSRSINSSCSSVSRQVSRSWPRCWTFFRRSGKSKRATG